MERTWEVFDSELANGREVSVYYDHKSTLTVVPNYARGRTLIFHDKDLNDDNVGEEVIVSCIVENNLLEEHTPAEIFTAARENGK